MKRHPYFYGYGHKDDGFIQSVTPRQCRSHQQRTHQRFTSRPSTPQRTYKELKNSVFSGSQDHFSFRKVVGRHGALIAELGEILHSASNDQNGAMKMQAALQQLYKRLAELNATWIRLICVPDDSVYEGRPGEDVYRNTVAGMIEIFSNRLVAMLTDKENECMRDPPFHKLIDKEAQFFCKLSTSNNNNENGKRIFSMRLNPEKAYKETRDQLLKYVECLERAWETIQKHGTGNESHFVTAADCISSGMALGSWLDAIVK